MSSPVNPTVITPDNPTVTTPNNAFVTTSVNTSDNTIVTVNTATVKSDINPTVAHLSPTVFTSESSNKIVRDTLCLSGGGVKGVAFIGCLKYLEEHHLLDSITTFAGTSTGTIIIMLHLLGYSTIAMEKLMIGIDFTKLMNPNITNILTQFGVDDGVRFETVFKKIITSRGFNQNITLSELFKVTNKKFILTVTNINRRVCKYISHESDPDMPVYLAVRASCCIPIFFKPVNYNGELLVDGGCINNYPINLFKHKMQSVLGLFLDSSENDVSTVNNLESYFSNMMRCFMVGANMHLKKGVESNTVFITINDVNSVNFWLTNDDKQKMVSTGYQTISDYFNQL